MRQGPKLGKTIWERCWKYRRSELALIRPIISQLESHGYGPDLKITRDINERYFSRAASKAQYRSLNGELKPLGTSVAILYALIEPAVVFHELWFYQLNVSKDTSSKQKRLYKDNHKHVRALIASGSGLSGQLKRRLRAEFDKATKSREGLTWLSMDWTDAQRNFLLREMGEKNLEGRQHRGKGGSYIMHKAPFWRKTLKVLMSHFQQKKLKPYAAAQLTYGFVRLIFPDIIPSKPTARGRWDFIRQRLRHTPKTGQL